MEAGNPKQAHRQAHKQTHPLRKLAGLKLSAARDCEIVMTRDFDAPARLVFDAFTKPELIRRWLLGPDGWTMPVCTVDLRVGGAYRYVWKRDSDGAEMGMGGVYREIRAPVRLVNTEHFDESWYTGDALVTTLFIEKDGVTSLTATMLYVSRETRDAVLASPMESGVSRSYDRLAEMLASPST